MSFPAQKSKIELKIAMKILDKLKVTYLISLLHISNENTAYLFDISNTSKQGPNTCYVALRRKRLNSYSSQTRSGAPFFYKILLGFFVIGDVLTKFEKKIYWMDFFQGNDLKRTLHKQLHFYKMLPLNKLNFAKRVFWFRLWH